MQLRSYADADGFLANAQAGLESNEVANCLMLGVCLRLVRYPERIESPPCLKTVEDDGDLVLASMMTPPISWWCMASRGTWMKRHEYL